MNDRREQLIALEEALRPLGENIFTAESADAGLRVAEERDLAVAVIDIRMPEIDGFAMVERLRARPKTRNLPVIFATAIDVNPDIRERIYRLGVADVVSLPIQPVELRSKVSVFAVLQRQRNDLAERAAEFRRNADATLQAQYERFRLFTEAAADYAMFFLDRAGIVTEWTAGAERLLGYAANRAIGRDFSEFLSPEDRRAGLPNRDLEEAARLGQSRYHRDLVRADGARLHVIGRMIALRRADGSLQGFANVVGDGTQHRRLEESEAKFREIFETASEGIWILDAEARIEIVNERLAQMLGYPRAEIVGRRKTDFVFPEDEAYIRGLFEERRRGVVASVDVRFRHRDGHEVWTLMSARPIVREGRFVGALDMFTDITERRMAVSALRASEEHFRVFFELAAVGNVTADPVTGRYVTANARFCEITGYTVDELRARSYVDLTYPDDRNRDAQRIQRFDDPHVRETTIEKRYVRKDGRPVWVEVTASLLRHDDGRPKLLIGVVQDITCRKRAENALRESQTQLRLAIEAADLGTFYYDQEEERVIWSERMKTMLGLPRDAAESPELFFSLVHPDDRPRVERMWEEIQRMTEGGDINANFRAIWPDGSVRHLDVASRTVIDVRPGGQHAFRLVGTIRDVTSVRKHQEELETKVNERTAALQEKTAQLETFCYTVAHDLRSPLRAISGYADFILQDFGPAIPAGATEQIGRIRSAAQRLDELIKDLLTYSRITQVDLPDDNVPLSASIDWALRQLAAEIEARHADVAVPPSLPLVRGDRSLLDQIALNLLSNAIKFVPPDRVPHVQVEAAEADGMVRLLVRDNGVGIAPQYYDRIFRVFERLQDARSVPGTGVGLAIVSRAANRLGGHAGVESQVGEGSTFWVDLRKAA